jgi:ATP-dependent Clp protease ATP-binding subunit ClpC
MAQMYERFTDRARKVMQLANQEAQRFSHEYIGTEHILLGLVKEGSGVAANVLKNLGIDLHQIRLEVEKIVQAGPDVVTTGKLPQTPRAEKVVRYSIEESRNLNHNYVGTEHLLLGLLREQEGVAAQVLMNLGLKLEDVREEVLNLLGHNMDSGESGGERTANKGKSKTPALDGVGRDLTELARQGKLDPVIGRQNELNRVVRVLSRRTRNNPILLGEAGVGKTALVRGLAELLVAPGAPPSLEGYRIVSVEPTLLLANTEFRGQLEARLKDIVTEIRRARHTILFLDDLHLWGSNQGVLACLTLSLGEVPCISATTPAEFARILETASSLGQFFVPVHVAPPSDREVLEVLRGLRDRYEAHHRVVIQDEALEAAVSFAAQGGSGASLLDRAFDLLDEAAADVRLRAIGRPPDLSELDAQIEQLNQEKESAVAEHDFDKAARLRDQADKLKKQKEQSQREWREKTRGSYGDVDAESIRLIANER